MRVFKLAGGDIQGAQFAKNLALLVFFILIEHGLKLRQGILATALDSRDASQLEVGIG